MLIGRDAELDEVGTALREARLVTITGTGGVGKTRLAEQVLADVDRPVLRALLAPFDAAGLRERVAGAAGRPSFDHLTSELRNDVHHVFLDNCEHVIDAAADLATEFLDVHPELSVIATSREPLALPGERVVRVQPLETGGPAAPAVELFRRAALSRGAAIADDDAEIAALCAELDGLPLALELAAARMVTMTAAEIRQALGERQDVLAVTRRGVPDRHRSLGAAIAWSYDLLDPDDQRLLNRLSMFPGRFLAETASHMVEGSTAVIDRLHVLVEQSLVVHEVSGGESWFRLLDTIRAFAGEQLTDSGERDEVGERLTDHLVERSRELDELGSRAATELPHYLLGSFPTIRWAIERTLERDEEASRANTLVAPLMWLEDVGYQGEAMEVIGAVIDRWPEPTPARGVGLGIVSALQRIAGWTERAARSAEAAIAAGDGVGVAYGERTLGQIERGEARWDEAILHFRRGAAAAWANDNPAFGVELGMHEGVALARAGRVDEAITLLDRLLEQAADFPHARASAALFLSWVLHRADPDRAERIGRQELATAEATGNAWAWAAASCDVAIAELRRGNHAAAAEHLHESLATYDEMHNRTDIAMPIEISAALFVRLDEPELARRFAAIAPTYTSAAYGDFELELFRELGPVPDPAGAEPLAVADALGHLARVRDGAGPEQPDPPQHEVEAPNRFLLDGEVWTITFAGKTIMLPPSKGLTDLHHLVARPGRDVPAIDLMGAVVTEDDTGAVLDRRARQSIEDRIRNIQEELVEAEDRHDTVRAERLAAEMDQLVDHLAAATGLSGRDRRAGATAERARSAVTGRIRSSIRRMAASHDPLARHFERSVLTGRFCRYDPPEPTPWQL